MRMLEFTHFSPDGQHYRIAVNPKRVLWVAPLPYDSSCNRTVIIFGGQDELKVMEYYSDVRRRFRTDMEGLGHE